MGPPLVLHFLHWVLHSPEVMLYLCNMRVYGGVVSEWKKPIVLLDIDGVVNALAKQTPTQTWKADEWNGGVLTEELSGINFHMKWATPVIDWLASIHTQGLAEIRWHSTWQEQAPRFGELAGLPVFGVQECPEWAKFNANGSALRAELIRNCQVPWWKYPAAERVASEGHPVVWIDDDITWEIQPKTRAALTRVHKLCLVSPSEGMGIAPKHMRQVDTFLAKWTDPKGAVSGS